MGRLSLTKDTRGTTSIEYGVVAALVAAGCLISIQSVGKNVAGLMQIVSAAIGSAAPASAPPAAAPNAAPASGS